MMEEKINGVTYECNEKKRNNIALHENGNVKWGWLAADAIIHGKSYLSGSRIIYYEDGTVKEVETWDRIKK